METTETLWRRIRSLPDGHRLFRLKDRPEMVALADGSGDTPDQTDDGVLWLDRHRPLQTTAGVCQIPLIDANGACRTAPTDVKTLLMLAADYDWGIRGAFGEIYTVNPRPPSKVSL